MTTSSSFLGSALSLLSVEQIAISTLKVRFTQDPLAASSTGLNDALNKNNYTISGGVNSVSSVSTISGDFQGFYLNLAVPLTSGSWTIRVANIQTALGNSLVSPTSLSFIASSLFPVSLLSNGANSQTPEDIIRKYIPKAISGKGIDSVIAALAAGDLYLEDTARKVFYQLLLSTASGKYLKKHASNYGITIAQSLNLSDEVFRELLISVINRKLTITSILKILEIFYGKENTRCTLDSILFEPFNIQEGNHLNITVDGSSVDVFFSQNDFKIYGAATAIEFASVITRAFQINNLHAFAKPYKDYTTGNTGVRIFSGTLGIRGSIAISDSVGWFPWYGTNNPKRLNQNKKASTAIQASDTETQVFLGATSDVVSRTEFDAAYLHGNQGTPLVFLSLTTKVPSFSISTITNTIPTLPVFNFVSPFYIINIGAGDRFYCSGYPTHTDLTYTAAETGIVAGIYMANTASSSSISTSIPATNCLNQYSGAIAPAYPAKVFTSFKDSTGLVTINTQTAHGLSVGENVQIDGAIVAVPYFKPHATSDFGITPIPTTITGYELVKLSNGKILLAGGYTTVVNSEAYLYNEATNRWTAVASMNTARYSFKLIALDNGRAMAIGGIDNTFTRLSSCEIYDPDLNIWINAASMVRARSSPVALKLNNGKVFVIYGSNGSTASTGNQTPEIYDTLTDTWTDGTIAGYNKIYSAGTLLNDGKIFICAGYGTSLVLTDTCEIYDPVTNTWDSTIPVIPRPVVYNQLLFTNKLGTNGSVMSFCGTNGTLFFGYVDIFDVVKNVWTTYTPGLPLFLSGGVTELKDGKLLIATGRAAFGSDPTFKIAYTLDIDAMVTGLPSLNELEIPDGNAPSTLDLAMLHLSNGDIMVSDDLQPRIIKIFPNISSGKINGQFKVFAVNAAGTTFSYQTDFPGISPIDTTSATLTSLKSITNPNTIGPYLLDFGSTIPAQSGQFYLTDSNIGRISAQEFIQISKAAGAKITETILYPNDIGLGNEGQPLSGSGKIADKVYIYGTEDELVVARKK